MPDHLTYFLRNLYVGQEATVRTKHGTEDWFILGIFFFFWLWDLSSPPIHPVVETWSPNRWTPRGFSSGVTWRKSEWSIYTLKIVTYTIIPTQVLSTGQGLYMRFRKKGKEWEAIIVYCWLFQRRQWHPTPVLLPRKSHGRRSLVGCSPWGREELYTTEQLHFHFSLSCIGEGNGNPLQCSFLKNPRDWGAWWAAVMRLHRVRHDWSDLAAAASADCLQQADSEVGVIVSIL